MTTALKFLVLGVLSISATDAFSDTCVGASAVENTTLTLSCGSGQVISSLAFVSYGTPTVGASNSCGSFKAGSCNSSIAPGLAQATCVGKTSCVLAASNILYGDPCYGTKKTLAIQAVCSASAASKLPPAYYVSPNGSDANDGLSSSKPFSSLERAQAAMRASSSIKTTYLMGGTYVRMAPLNLTSSDAGESWLGYPGQTPVLDGEYTTKQAIYINGNNITVRWLTIQSYALNGIVAQSVSGTVIDSNTIRYIMSNSWNQGGIALFNNITDARVSHNLLQNLQYTGIMYANSAPDTIRNLVIDSNAVYNACSGVADCGALYADDRSHTATGVVFNNNIVGNYGTLTNQSKAIYLDDRMSNATVKNNIIYGTGSQSVQYHAGDHNVVENNIFDVSNAGAVAFYQDDGTGTGGFGMKGNVFTCNIVYSSHQFPSSLWVYSGKNIAPPSNTGNLYWDGSGTFSNSGSIQDTSPRVGNPGFTNVSKANYSFSGSPASFCNFVPINTSQVGPLPN